MAEHTLPKRFSHCSAAESHFPHKGTEKVNDMRKLIISILLAGAAASPALAQDQGRWHHDDAQSSNQQAREERSQAREQRQEMREQVRAERSSGAANVERMQEMQQQQQARQQAARQFEGRQQWEGQAQEQGRGGWDRSRMENDRAMQQRQAFEQQQQVQRNSRGYRGGFAGQPEQVDRAQRDGGWAGNRGNWNQDRSAELRQRQVEQQQQRMRQGSRWANGGWNRDWRNDHRYDWRSYRDRHRSVFRLGIYFDPFGYGYRQFNIGYNLPQLYYGQRYWIDPALYELPYPPPGTIWVRYWNDAVLVDTYSGEVVDVIHNFFW